eukprot:TRINITY_DN636_c0_g1_i1.p1 TRINITY_DN636_c0_g1~~TRINITY_DN636_c0_g1_i1.p1  ORF type:complete len:159 (+),score=55.71 TRINITY_DN636_c0_g1_i1:277-753(+)
MSEDLEDSWENITEVPTFQPHYEDSAAWPKPSAAPPKKKHTETKSLDNALKEAHPFFESQPTIRILSRKDQKGTPSSSSSSTQTQAVPQPPQKSIEEREKEYLAAKQRLGISHHEPPSTPPSVRETGSNKDSPQIRQPKGPVAGTGKGFGRGKGKEKG